MFELITECSLIFSIIPFLITKNKKKSLVKINKLNAMHKMKIKKHKNNILKILILIFIASLIKFNFTIYIYEVFNEYFYIINKFSRYYSNSIMMISLILFIFIRIKILKNNFYLHHLISMSLIIITLIPIAIISFSIEEVNKNLGIKFLLYIFFYIYIFILVFLGYMIYKILTEKYFISIYLINSIEGLFFIFYTFILYYFKIKDDNKTKYGDPFEYDKINLFFSCILQNIVNIMIKLIIYYFDEIFITISILISNSIYTILGIKFEKKDIINMFLLLLNIFLILNILLFLEVIIIKIFNLEKKTKKYLLKEQEKEKNISLENNNLYSCDGKNS